MRVPYVKGKGFRAFDLLLVAALVVLLFGERIRTLDASVYILIAVAFALLCAISVVAWVMAGRKTQRELNEERDERNRYVEMQCKAKSAEIVSLALYIVIAGGLVWYGLTEEVMAIWMFIGAAVPFLVLKACAFVLPFYYDRV